MQRQEEVFWQNLLKKTHHSFQECDIKITQENLGEKWNYAICDTPIKKNQGIVLGLNWGGNFHDPQSQYPIANKSRNWNFINNSKYYFEHYLGVQRISEVNYSNLCFYRSPNISCLTPKDWEISLPLLKEYVDFISPPWILLLGTTGIQILKNNNLVEKFTSYEIQGKKRRIFGYTLILFNNYKLFCVPHPQARISTIYRKSIWELVTNNKSQA